jgi:thioredoxin-related protein
MKYTITMIFLFGLIAVKAQSNSSTYENFQNAGGKVNWVNFEDAEKLSNTVKKPILISVHTEWCGWCKKMEITTFKDPQITSYLNSYFYPIHYDAETSDTITFKGKTYTNPFPGTKRSTHSLAPELMGTSRSYPTTILMDHNYQNAVVIPGFLSAKDIASFLVFYKEEVFKSENINNFRVDFDNTFGDKKGNINSQVIFTDLQTALNQNDSLKKKIFVHFYDSSCISCQVMDSVSYTNPFVTRFLNDNYLNVRFDINSKDTIIYNGQPILPSTDYDFNNFAVSVLKGKMKTPAVAFINEENKIIFPIQEYLNKNSFEVVLNYINDDAFKDQTFQDYNKTFNSKIIASQQVIKEINTTLSHSKSQMEAFTNLIKIVSSNTSLFE